MRIGGHVSTSGGIHTAIDRAEAIGAEAVQIFTQSPRAWRPTNHDPANLERFKERVAEAGIDSCHLYASGCDVTDPAALDAVLDELDGTIGLDRLRALHVNDSKAPLGSNRDRHENVGDGLLGRKLGVFLRHPRLQGLPALL